MRIVIGISSLWISLCELRVTSIDLQVCQFFNRYRPRRLKIIFVLVDSEPSASVCACVSEKVIYHVNVFYIPFFSFIISVFFATSWCVCLCGCGWRSNQRRHLFNQEDVIAAIIILIARRHRRDHHIHCKASTQSTVCRNMHRVTRVAPRFWSVVPEGH